MKQREIKFRAWNKESKKMVSLEYMKLLQTEDGVKVGPFEFADTPDGDGFILMQYAGLKDKNGKEIYEGDVVAHMVKDTPESTEETESFRSVIEWWPDMVDVSKAVIIGNIYENPELLNPLD